MLVYGARDAFADAMFDFARAYAQMVCPRLADDLRGATDWYKAHDGPLYIRVNAQAFLGAGLDEELRIVEEVRVALGLPALRSLPTTRLGAADAAALSTAAIMNRATPARASDRSWAYISGLLGARFDKMVRQECPDSLFAEQDWRVEVFGRSTV